MAFSLNLYHRLVTLWLKRIKGQSFLIIKKTSYNDFNGGVLWLMGDNSVKTRNFFRRDRVDVNNIIVNCMACLFILDVICSIIYKLR